MPISGRLRSWAAVDDGTWTSLLLGNGSSIAISPQFSYTSLRDEANLGTDDEQLFKELETANFETVLSALRLTRIVCRQEGHGGADARQRYRDIRRALVRAVNKVHVDWTSLTTAIRRQMRAALLEFDTVYTTNYDLLAYWAVMTDRPSDFRDFFWGPDASFDPDDVSTPTGITRILYLHGALHLYAQPDGGTAKLTAGGRNLLSRMAARTSTVPLFVCEGHSRDKRIAIARSDYLSFANGEFGGDGAPLAIFGHSLGEQDAHLLPQIDKPARRVAISIMPAPPNAIIRRKAELKELLPNARLSYFDATTHPLGDPTMRAAP